MLRVPLSDMSTEEKGNSLSKEFEVLSEELDALFQGVVVPNTPHYLYDPVHYVLEHGGKRIRPMLVVLASRLFDGDSTAAFPAAVAVQLFHDFTLVHDDIMDHADERRGRPSVYKQYDASSAILSGDLLLCLAYDRLSGLTDSTIHARASHVFTQMAMRVCEGQALDAEMSVSTESTIDDYLQMIDGKTAALLEACLQIGGIVGRLPEDAIMHLKYVGNNIGRAFQIQDDLLDIIADSASWGKPVGGDLVEGKRSYPILKGIAMASEQQKPWFDLYFENKGIGFDEVEEARSLLEATGAIDATKEEVERYSRLANDSLNELPSGTTRDMLRALIDRLGGRSH